MSKVLEIWLMCGGSIEVAFACEASWVDFRISKALIRVHWNADSQGRLSQER